MLNSSTVFLSSLNDEQRTLFTSFAAIRNFKTKMFVDPSFGLLNDRRSSFRTTLDRYKFAVRMSVQSVYPYFQTINKQIIENRSTERNKCTTNRKKWREKKNSKNRVWPRAERILSIFNFYCFHKEKNEIQNIGTENVKECQLRSPIHHLAKAKRHTKQYVTKIVNRLYDDDRRSGCNEKRK